MAASMRRNIGAAKTRSEATIADAIARYAGRTQEVLICGGGVHNTDLMRRLGDRMPGIPLMSTADSGLNPDRVEACAFAWLAIKLGLGELPEGALWRQIWGGALLAGIGFTMSIL